MKIARFLIILILIAVAFFGGLYYERFHQPSAVAIEERKPLYYVDPMHPAYKSDKPGIAPDCGMKYMPRATAFGKLKAMCDAAAKVRREIS